MKIRVFKLPDGYIAYDIPCKKYQDKIQECKVPEHLNGLPFFIADAHSLPPKNSTNGNYGEMVYCDGDFKLENIKQDKEWNVVLMPDFLIKQKRIEDHNSKLDAELAKESPDAVAVVKLQRNIEQCKAETCPIKHKEWALEGLDERVAKGKPDKEVVRAKLLSKIQEIKNK